MSETIQFPSSLKVIEKNPVSFIVGDNMEYLRWCKKMEMYKHFHFGVVDPPYGISVGDMKLGATKNSKERNYKMGSWDGAVPSLEYWHLLNYCCRDLIIWGGNYFTQDFGNFMIAKLITGEEVVCRSIDVQSGEVTSSSNEVYSIDLIAKIYMEKGIRSGRCFYSWDKKNNGMSFADCELALTTIDSVARVIPKSRSLSDSDDGEKRHPTHKPVYLYDYLHLENKMRGKRVLDTHGGSHSHAIAAYRNNVTLTIIEREQSYHDDGMIAYDKATVKPKLLF